MIFHKLPEGCIGNPDLLGPLLHRIATLILTICTIILSISPSNIGHCAEKRSVPNIVLILTDDQGYGDLSCHGNPVLKTPNLDRLHAEGVRFTEFHVSPTCAPTRCSLLTGRHEFKSGVTHTILERERMSLKATTLAQVLKSAGYTTGVFGKWHLGDEPERWPDKRGFDEMFIHGAGGIGQTYAGSCGDAPGNTYFSPAILHNGKFEKTAGYCTDVFFGQATRWIDSVKGKRPFFAYIPTNAAHMPLQVPKEYEQRYAGKVPAQAAKFFGMIANIDDNVGHLLAKLKQWGIERDTLVIFMTDNGGTAGLRVWNAGLRGGKGTPWQGGTRAASFWRWPGTLQPADVQRLAAHIDVFPTLVELAGAKVPRDVAAKFDGRSLTPLLRNPHAPWADRYLVTHLGRWPKGKARESKYSMCSVRNSRYSLVCTTRDGSKKWELFDLQSDPGQKNDLAAQRPEVVKELEAAYDRWWQEVLPCMENEDAVAPARNPFKELFWKQFGEGRLSSLPGANGSCKASAQTSAQAAPLTLDRLRAERRQMAHRPRRLIFNNDGCDCLYFPKDKPVTAPNLLALRTKDLVGTHVDSIFYCTISSGFSFFTHGTQAGTLLTRSPAEFGIPTDTRNVTQDLIDQGRDCLQVMIDFARKQDKEIFWSMRMNDTHDAAHRPDKPYLLFPPLKAQHPDWLVGNPVQRTPFGRWSSVDYARPEIRDLALRFIEEVCHNYDVDGVELDFFRHLCYFKSVAMGGKASQDDRDKMTDLLRCVRRMTEEAGLGRGRPILVAVRVPDSVEYCRDMGFDLPRWLEEGLVDLLATTCYFQLNPWSYSAALGHKYGVPVYPSLSESRVQGQSRFSRASVECYRGRATNAWLAGMDGMYLFNFFDVSSSRSPVLREIGDPAVLQFKNKLYFATVRDGNPNSCLSDGVRYQTVPILTPGHPLCIKRSSPLKVNVTIGEDLAAARQAGRTPTLKCHAQMPHLRRAEQVVVKFNGRVLSGGKVSAGWLDFPLPADCLQRGDNQVEIALSDQPGPADEWDIVYQGDRLPGAPWHRDPGSPRTEQKLVADGLSIADRGTQNGDYLYWRFPWGADAAEETVVEVRAKAVAGSSYVIVSNGAASERLGLWPDHIDLWANRAIQHRMDAASDFHVYRLTMKGNDLKVFVDGALRLDASGKLRPANNARNELAFGAANSGMEGEACWAYVKARASGQSCTDLVVSVDYPAPAKPRK